MRVGIVVLTVSLSTLALAGENKLLKDYDPPAISLQQALNKAELCLKDRKIDLSNSFYLKSAVFENVVTKEDGAMRHGRYWHFFWLTSIPMPEGSTTIRIYEDSTCMIGQGNAPLR